MGNGQPSGKAAGRKTILLGAALATMLVVPLGGSAALSGGGFFIHAYNDQEVEIEATAGLRGTTPGGPGEPGGENPGNSLASTVVCGDESVTVTQAMLDFSNGNREAVAAGGSAETWPGGNWKFIAAGSYYEVIAGAPAPVAMDHDRFYIFSNSAAISTADYILPAVKGSIQYTDGQDGPLFQDISLDSMNESNGETAAMIGALSAKVGNDTMELCSYLKFENGKVSSSSGPAVYTEQNSVSGSEKSGGNVSGYLKSGMPAFGPDRPSIVAISKGPGYSMTDDTYFLEGNRESWDYLDISGSLWHPTKKIFKSADRTVVTDWTECFGDSCEVKVANPTISRSVTPADALNPEITLYTTSAPINGATSIQLNKRPNGTLIRAEYANRNIKGGWENGVGRWSFSRIDGPATFSEDESGNIYSTEYYVDGYAKLNQTQYESAGGTGWMGLFSGGIEQGYLGD